MSFLKNLLYSSMQSLARFSVSRKKPYVIGITGSVGKTSCRMIITEVLQQQLPELKVYTSPSNYNSELGLALSVLAIENFSHSVTGWIRALMTGFLKALQGCPYDVLLLEYGIDFPGEMEIELGIIKPDTAIFTSVDMVHAHQLLSKDGILTEKSKLLKSAQDIIAYPIQSNYIRPYIASAKRDHLVYSLVDGASTDTNISWKDHSFLTHEHGLPQASFHASFGQNEVHIQTNLLGTEHASYITLALQLTQIIAIRKGMHYNFPNILDFQGQLQPGRYSILEGVGDTILIDSSYNAAPQSMHMMINNALRLRDLCYPERPLRLVLGEMRELGDFTKDEHEKFAHYVAGLDVEKYFLVGQSMKDYVLPILKKKGKEVIWEQSSRELGIMLRNSLTPTLSQKEREQEHPIILFKGSQNTIFLEETVKSLLKNPEDKKFLCRQSKEWMGKKEKRFSSLKS